MAEEWGMLTKLLAKWTRASFASTTEPTWPIQHEMIHPLLLLHKIIYDGWNPLSHLSPYSGLLTPSLSFPTWQHRPIFDLIPSMLTLLSFPPSKLCYSSFAWHTKAKQLLAPHHTLLQAQVPLAMGHEPILKSHDSVLPHAGPIFSPQTPIVGPFRETLWQ